jgi:hypothetical protein
MTEANETTTKKKATRKRTTTKPKVAAKTPAKPRQSLALSLPNNPLVFEIFDLASRQRSKAKKVEVLQKYANMAVKALLIWNFDESVSSALPGGEVPYSGYNDQNVYNGSLSSKIEASTRDMYDSGNFSLGSSDTTARTTLRREARNLYHFVKGGNDDLTNTRREMMFINILESVHPLEAEILILVKDKNLTDKYKIPFEVVEQAYDDIRWGSRA